VENKGQPLTLDKGAEFQPAARTGRGNPSAAQPRVILTAHKVLEEKKTAQHGKVAEAEADKFFSKTIRHKQGKITIKLTRLKLVILSLS
jgi:hypothetical protein